MGAAEAYPALQEAMHELEEAVAAMGRDELVMRHLTRELRVLARVARVAEVDAEVDAEAPRRR